MEPASHYLGPDDWNRIEEYRFADDLPVPARFEELDQRFDDAKFIYTVRYMDTWLASCEYLVSHLKKFGDWPEWMTDYHVEMYGTPYFDRELFRRAYHRHDEHVRDYFSGRLDDLLIMNIVQGDGWEKLIPFVGLENTKFPHINRRQ